MKKKIGLAGILLIFLIIASGCLASQNAPVIKDIVSESPGNTSSQSYDNAEIPQEEYVGIYPLGSYDYFIDHKVGLMRAGEELNVKTQYIGPMDNNIDEMIQDINGAVARQVDGLVVFGADTRLGPSIDKAWEKGIPTVTVDGDVANCKRIAFVGTGNYNAGYLGGTKLASVLNGVGNIAILTEPGMQLHDDRTQGYEDALKKSGIFNVLTIADTKADLNLAHDAAVSLLKKYPELNAIACTDYFGGMAASVAVEENNLQGKVKIMSMDRSSYVLQKIEEGVITATLVQQTALMSYYAMQVLYDYKHNPVPIAANAKDAGITGAPVYIDTGVFVIDKSNYKLFMRN